MGTLNYTNLFTSPVSYVSISYGGSQARAACSPDNQNFIIDDKGGLYVNGVLNLRAKQHQREVVWGRNLGSHGQSGLSAHSGMYQFANGGEIPFLLMP